MPLELEDYGSFTTGPSIIDLEYIIYVSKVKKYVREYDHMRMWYMEYQMHGSYEVQKIECKEKRIKWRYFVLEPEPAGRIYQLQKFLAHRVKVNLQKMNNPHRVVQDEF
jgi:hypothetical protein